jgi:hypothetical protein
VLGAVLPVAVPDAKAAPEAAAAADPDAEAQHYGAARPPYNPGCGLMDTCCGMSQEGCCMGGQQCYTYYENVCENVNEPQCNMRGKEVCEPVTLPDCRVTKERGKLVGSTLHTLLERVSDFPVPQAGCHYNETLPGWE